MPLNFQDLIQISKVSQQFLPFLEDKYHKAQQFHPTLLSKIHEITCSRLITLYFSLTE